MGNTGSNTATLTVTDIVGNVGLCTSEVTVLDSNPPDAVCQDHTQALQNDGTVIIDASDLDGGSSDAGGIAGFSAAPDSFSCGEIGAPNQVVLTVTDNLSLIHI